MTLANDLSVQETRRVGKDILICGKKYTCLLIVDTNSICIKFALSLYRTCSILGDSNG